MVIYYQNDEALLFSNLKKITFDHTQDCCEENYADFKELELAAFDEEFAEPLTFEAVDGAGFRFGNPGKMYFVPCYSIQSGAYTSNIDIYYDDKKVLSFDAKEILNI